MSRTSLIVRSRHVAFAWLSVCLALLLTGGRARAMPADAQPTENPCTDRGTALLLRASAHRMWLCRAGAVDAEFEVALGAGGIGKRVKRDKKTPLGSYRVGKPRRSSRYRSFIPIGYPTAAQRRAGYSGSDIGIHGPDPMFSWEGTVDWTNGCIALKENEDIDALVAWTKKWRPKQIEIVE